MGALFLTLFLGGLVAGMKNVRNDVQVRRAEIQQAQLRKKAPKKFAKSELGSLAVGLEAYKALGGSYPSTEQGVEALWKRPDQAPRPRQWVQFLTEKPKDPWGRSYRYQLKDGKFKLWSIGPDLKDPKDDLLYSPPQKDEGKQ
jgi:general secretion pathway protein G